MKEKGREDEQQKFYLGLIDAPTSKTNCVDLTKEGSK